MKLKTQTPIKLNAITTYLQNNNYYNTNVKKNKITLLDKLISTHWIINFKKPSFLQKNYIFIQKKIKNKKLTKLKKQLKLKKLLLISKKEKTKQAIKPFIKNYYLSKLTHSKNKYILKLIYESNEKDLTKRYKFDKKILNFDKLELMQKKKIINNFFKPKKKKPKKKNLLKRKKNLDYKYYQLKLNYSLTSIYSQKFNVTLQNGLTILNKNDILERLNSSIFNKAGGMRAQKFNSHLTHTVNLINLSCLYFDPNALTAHFANEFKIKKNQKIILLQSRYILKQFIQNPYSPLKGIMVLVSGRINNIKRTRKFLLKLGEIHIQTVKNNIFYSYDTSITKFGSFGLKIWMHI